jgi:hypothetical protein
MNRTEHGDPHEVGRASPPDWTRAVGWVAIVAGAVTVLAAVVSGWFLQGMGQIPVSNLEELGGYVFYCLPLGIVSTVVLAFIAGTRRGIGRRLGLVAGLLVIGTIPACGLVVALLPLRN